MGKIGFHLAACWKASDVGLLCSHWAINSPYLIYTKLMQISIGMLYRPHRNTQLLEESALNDHFIYTRITSLVRLSQVGKLHMSRFRKVLLNYNAKCHSSGLN